MASQMAGPTSNTALADMSFSGATAASSLAPGAPTGHAPARKLVRAPCRRACRGAARRAAGALHSPTGGGTLGA